MTAYSPLLVPQVLPSMPFRLNPAQQAAVDYRGGHLGIIAGAGTGKTTTLAHRAKGLIAEGCHPSQIVLLSYTCKAAEEVRYRCAGLIPDGDLITAGTIHSFAARMLHQHGHLIGLAPFTVIDRSSAESLLSYLRKELRLVIPQDVKSRQIAELLSYADNVQRPVEQLLAEHKQLRDCVSACLALYHHYLTYKRDFAQLDYDDLLWQLQDLALQQPQVFRRFRHFFVDETQDLSRFQLTLLQALLDASGAHCTAVGDPLQSIYGFRAAEPAGMETLIKALSAQVLTLADNNRSTQQILDTCNQLVAQLPGCPMRLVGRRQGAKPRFQTYPSDAAEARIVAAAVYADIAAGISPKSIACLYSRSQHGIKLQAELTALGLPFHTCGGGKVTESAHVRDMLALLHLSFGPDPLSARRILMRIPGIGEAKAERIVAEGFSSSAVPPKSRARVESLAACIEAMRGAQPDAAWAAAWAWYQPLTTPLQRYDLEQLGLVCASSQTVRDYLAQFALQSGRKEEGGVCLSTVHSIKGREFRSVYVLGLSEGVFTRAKLATPEYAESVRLLYVAMTRAADFLHLSAPLLCQMPDRSYQHTSPLPHIAFLH